MSTWAPTWAPTWRCRLLHVKEASTSRRPVKTVTTGEEVSLPDPKRLYNAFGNIANPDVGKVGKRAMSWRFQGCSMPSRGALYTLTLQPR
jgi:hypothetical protein